MSSQRLRLLVLCEDRLQREFIERLADRWDIGARQRTIQTAPAARQSASKYVLDQFVEFVGRWRASQHDRNVAGIVMIDGDERGIRRRRDDFAALLRAAGDDALDVEDRRFAFLIPCWHIETWIAWLCQHRPVDEQTRYKASDPRGAAVAREIEARRFSAGRAVKSWLPAAADEAAHLPSLASARDQLRRLGVGA